MPFISFIIPIYNTKEFLEQCLSSILSQNYSDIEIIMIDDGSTDGSELICDRYRESHRNVKVIHTVNQGQAKARNIGIEEAKGKYIIFLDSDDYWQPNVLERLAESLNMGKVDVLAYNYTLYNEGKKAYQDKFAIKFETNIVGTILSGEDFLTKVLKSNEIYHWFPVKYAVKRKFFNRFGFKFKADIKYEDVDLIYRVLLKAKSVLVSDSDVYTYRVNRKGQTTDSKSMSLKTRKDCLLVIRRNIKHVKRLAINTELKRLLCNNFSIGYYSIVMSFFELSDKSERSDLFEDLKKSLWVCKYTTRTPQRISYILIQILGLRMAIYLWRIVVLFYRKIKLKVSLLTKMVTEREENC